MGEIKKTIIKTDKLEETVAVEADTVEEFLEYELQCRLKELEDVGPFGPHQAIPFIKQKQNIVIYIVLGICVLAHLWARLTIGS